MPLRQAVLLCLPTYSLCQVQEKGQLSAGIHTELHGIHPLISIGILLARFTFQSYSASSFVFRDDFSEDVQLVFADFALIAGGFEHWHWLAPVQHVEEVDEGRHGSSNSVSHPRYVIEVNSVSNAEHQVAEYHQQLQARSVWPSQLALLLLRAGQADVLCLYVCTGDSC